VRIGALLAASLALVLLAGVALTDPGSASRSTAADSPASSWWTSFAGSDTAASKEAIRKHHRRHHPRRKQRAAAANARAAASRTASPAGSTPATQAKQAPASSPSPQPATPKQPLAVSRAGAPYLPYTADSLFRKPLPDNAPVSPDNAQMVAWTAAHEPDPYLKIRGANGVGWGIAYAEATCSDPIYRIGPGGSVPASQEHLRTVGFHAPADVWKNIPQNGDAPFLIVDRCGTSARPAGLSVWGANAAVSGSTVNVSAAGSFAHDTNGLDRRNPLSNSQLNERSRGVIPDSMLIRLDALDYAIRNGTGLGYALEVFWVETNSAAGFSSPMVGAESGKNGVGAEGQRIRIKPGIDLAARPGCSPTTNPVGLAIARTLQQNGAYIGDNSGSGSGIKTQQNAQFPGLNADSLRGCMTWNDIEFLPVNWQG
jgi:hypothetical protein